MTLAGLTFALAAAVILGGAVAAVVWRNLIHSALALAASLAGLAAVFLQLHAQFVGFAQVLVYVGSVAILIVFAILLTRGTETPGQPIFSAGALTSTVIALAVFVVLARVVLTSRLASQDAPPPPSAPVAEIGRRMMTQYVLPLEIMGLLLTAALIGGVLLALRERPPR